MTSVVSVIIPAYNSEETIEKCIDSITSQTYSDLEIIVVNDGSQDDTESIVKRISSKDHRVKLISIPNGGVSHARNVGIDNATGEYITFVDSDDTIDKEMYQSLMELFQRYNADIVHCSYKTVHINGSVIPVGGTGKIVVQESDEAIEYLISGKLFGSGLCNKIFKKELLKNSRLNENIKINEDYLMNFELFEKASCIVYLDSPFYNYMQLESSSTHTTNSAKSACDKYRVSQKIYDKSIGKVYEPTAKRKLASTLLGLYGSYSLNKDTVTKRELKNLEKQVIGFKNQGLYSKNDRIRFVLFRFFPKFYSFSYKFYDRIRIKKLDPEQ